ncbi:glycine zipper 2TM domain-containing protein [Propionivibrio sp.]|uniref:glycine zipper 2TM domain-containing protein n=1 Tax=Propionivibrio sp. TaxID=2212460 RepID=UPI003BF3C031
MENQTRSTHPMIIVAATTVSIASLAAIASIAGWIPGNNNNNVAPAAQVAVAPTTPLPATPAAIIPPAPVAAPVAATPAPAKAAPVRQAAPRRAPREDEYAYDSTPSYNNRGATPVGNYPMNDSGVYVEQGRQQRQQQQQYSNTCRDCATVESVREVKQDGEGTGLGAISGGVVGGLLGNQIGNGRGKTVGAVVGAVGGAYAGNAVEKNVRSSKHYEITVRLDDGNTRVFSESQPPSVQRGDRVRISNGQLSRM